MKPVPIPTLQEVTDSRISKLALIFRRLGAVSWLPFIAYCTLWLGLDACRLWDRDEPRNARCAIEMLQRGDWVVPVFNEQLRTHKPILLYWLQMLSYRLFGENDFAARAGSALMASMTLLVTFWLGKYFIDSKAGFWAAAVLASSLMFVVAGRVATPDACLIATSALGVLGLVLHWQTGKNSLTRYCFAGYFALGLAVLAKGPVGIVLPMIVVIVWGCVQGEGNAQLCSEPFRWQNALQSAFWGCWGVLRRFVVIRGLLIAFAVAAPWYIWVGLRTDGAWLTGFFFEHNLGRAMSTMEGHRGGWWFYPLASLVGLFPWSLLLLPIGIWIAQRFRGHSSSPAVQLGLIWIAVYMTIFSIARTKLPSYITPCYPGAALLIGGFLSDWSNRRLTLSTRWLIWVATVFALTFVVIVASIVFLSLQYRMPSLLPHVVWGIGFALAAAMLIHARYFGEQQRLPWYILGASAVFLAGFFAAAGPAVGRYRTDIQAILTQQTFVDAIGNEQATRWMATRTVEPSWIYYLKSPIIELPLLEKDLEPNRTEEIQLPSDERLRQIAKHLEMPSGRLIVDAQQVEHLELILDEQYGLRTKTSISFRAFLRSQDLVVLQLDRQPNLSSRGLLHR